MEVVFDFILLRSLFSLTFGFRLKEFNLEVRLSIKVSLAGSSCWPLPLLLDVFQNVRLLVIIFIDDSLLRTTNCLCVPIVALTVI